MNKMRYWRDLLLYSDGKQVTAKRGSGPFNRDTKPDIHPHRGANTPFSISQDAVDEYRIPLILFYCITYYNTVWLMTLPVREFRILIINFLPP